jgi:PAS domain S-box-containing protein
VEDGNFFLKLVHPEDFGTRVERAAAAAAGSGLATVEYRLLDRRGETRWFRDEAVLVRDPAGEPLAWHGVLVEITGIKEMQEHRSPRSSSDKSPPPSTTERPEHA